MGDIRRSGRRVGHTLSYGLGCVGVEVDSLVLSEHGSDFFDGLNGSDLVVDHHDLS